MSRSYKKTNYCGDKKDKELKRLANHRVRQYLKNHLDYNPKPADHKRMFETYEICDYGWICSWEEYWQRELDWYYCDHYGRYHRAETPPNYKEEYCNWHRYYKMK